MDSGQVPAASVQRWCRQLYPGVSRRDSDRRGADRSLGGGSPAGVCAPSQRRRDRSGRAAIVLLLASARLDAGRSSSLGTWGARIQHRSCCAACGSCLKSHVARLRRDQPLALGQRPAVTARPTDQHRTPWPGMGRGGTRVAVSSSAPNPSLSLLHGIGSSHPGEAAGRATRARCRQTAGADESAKPAVLPPSAARPAATARGRDGLLRHG